MQEKCLKLLVLVDPSLCTYLWIKLHQANTTKYKLTSKHNEMTSFSFSLKFRWLEVWDWKSKKILFHLGHTSLAKRIDNVNIQKLSSSSSSSSSSWRRSQEFLLQVLSSAFSDCFSFRTLLSRGEFLRFHLMDFLLRILM